MLYWCKYLIVDYTSILQGILKSRSAVLRPVDSQLGKDKDSSSPLLVSTAPLAPLVLSAWQRTPAHDLSCKQPAPNLPWDLSQPEAAHQILVCPVDRVIHAAWRLVPEKSYSQSLDSNNQFVLNSPWAKWSVESSPSLFSSTVMDNGPE